MDTNVSTTSVICAIWEPRKWWGGLGLPLKAGDMIFLWNEIPKVGLPEGPNP